MKPTRTRPARACVVALALFLSSATACGRGGGGTTSPTADAGVTPTTRASAEVASVTNAATTTQDAAESAASRTGALVDFIAQGSDCTLSFKGPLLDLGEPGLRVRGSVGEELKLESVEREGASFARVRERTITVPFYVSADEERTLAAAPTEITAHVRGGAAKTVSVFLNGKPAGALRPTKNETKVLTATAPGALVSAGLNELMLRFQAPARGDRDVMAEIDWIHVGAGDTERTFAAPTHRDVLVDRPLAGRIEKVFALRAESTVRCMGYLPAAATLELDVAAEGGGEVEIEARLLRDRSAPQVLGRATVGDRATPQRMPIPRVEGSLGTVGAIEIAVVRAAKGGRALLGHPRLVAAPLAPAPKPSAPMQGAVLVVFGTVEPKSLAPYGGQLGGEGFAAIAREGTTFKAHRSESTFAHAALAAMLTGHGPRTLRLEDGEAKLPTSVTTIADAARQAGIVTALFTGNPTTTAAYGFDRSWETSSAVLSDVDPSGTRVFDDAAAWLRAHKDERFLLVVHARGGHPPWAATPEQLKTMAPPAYAGGLDAKHAGELLAKARHVPPLLRFNDADRARAFALHAAAVTEADRARARLVAEVHAIGKDDRTLFMVTSDVGVSTAASVPFGDGEAPSEQLLSVPLIARAPGLFPKGASSDNPTGHVDVARTMLRALGLAPPSAFEGMDLARVAATPSGTLGRALFATVLGKHSLRFGSLVLEADSRRELLCDVSLEPLCTTDVKPTHPLALFVLERGLALEKAPAGAASVTREAATVDAHLQPLLRAFGR
ncbi:MAG: sulfatase-like hydrolase/transferase [Polyangiaceae bacterium]